MNSPTLGRLEKLNLRDYWAHEATSFTPWLAQDENIRLLAETIGIPLEVQGQEVHVGPFRADILCQVPYSGQLVLIENQLERTDHWHLGQILTYAAGLDAVTIIWIASAFTEEHRAALDWLNRVTHEGINLFGLEVELWRISESIPAPKFNIVSKPNGWTKLAQEVSKQGGEALTPTRQLQLDFWTEFNAHLAKQKIPFRPVKPQADSWLVYGTGGQPYTLETVANSRDNWIGVRLSMKKHVYQGLVSLRDEIEKNLGEALDWTDDPSKTVGVIVYRRTADLALRQLWTEHHNWLCEAMDATNRIFAEAAKSLPIS